MNVHEKCHKEIAYNLLPVCVSLPIDRYAIIPQVIGPSGHLNSSSLVLKWSLLSPSLCQCKSGHIGCSGLL